MMIRSLLIFLLLLSSVWLGIQLQHDPGYVFISLGHWTIELTAWTALVTLFVFFCVAHVFLITISWLVHLPRRLKAWYTMRRAQRTLAKQQHMEKRNFKQRLGLQTTPEAYFALGQLLDDLNDSAGACRTYREGLRSALSIKAPLK